MLLVDTVVEQSGERLVCTKTFSCDDFFVQGHFPGFPIVPGVILCECALQAGALLVAAQSELAQNRLPVVTRMDGVKFKKMVRPGDTVQIEVALDHVVSQAYFMTGKVTVDGKLAARLEFACSFTEPEGQK